MKHWIAAFVLTQLVEVPIYTVGLRGRAHIAFAASLITHPILWWTFNPLRALLGLHYGVVLLLAELCVVGVEAMFLARFALKRAWLWALGANLASVAVGMATRALWGWP